MPEKPQFTPEQDEALTSPKEKIDLFTPTVEGNRINATMILEEISKINQELSNNPDHVFNDLLRVGGFIYRRPKFKGGGVAPEVVEQIRIAQDETRRRLEEEFNYREIPIIPGQTRFDWHLHRVGTTSDYVYTDNRALNEVIESVRASGCIQDKPTGPDVKMRASVRMYTTDPDYKPKS